jgi:adenylate cyclase
VERVFAQHPPDSPEAIRVRMGAHSGFVIAEADDFYGRNVVLAARIADQADGGEILVSEATKQYTEADPTLRFELRGEFRLKGLVGEHAVYALLWE